MDPTVPIIIVLSVLGVLVVIHTVILMGLVRIIRSLQNHLSAISPINVGAESPEWSGLDLDGHAVAGRDFAGRLRVLLFVSPDCSACTTTLSELQLLNYKSRGNAIAICQGGPIECRNLLEPYLSAIRVVLDETAKISSQFDVRRYPTAVLLDADDRVRSVGHPERDEIDAALADDGGHGRHDDLEARPSVG